MHPEKNVIVFMPYHYGIGHAPYFPGRIRRRTVTRDLLAAGGNRSAGNQPAPTRTRTRDLPWDRLAALPLELRFSAGGGA